MSGIDAGGQTEHARWALSRDVHRALGYGWLGYVVAQIDTIDVLPDTDPAPAARALPRLAGRPRCASRHLPSGEPAAARMDAPRRARLPLHRDRLQPSPCLPSRRTDAETSRVRIDGAVEADRDALEHIASTAFTTGRYHLDWRLDAEASDRRYRRWLLTALADDRQHVLKASVRNEIVGFFVLETRPGDAVTGTSPRSHPIGRGRASARSCGRG